MDWTNNKCHNNNKNYKEGINLTRIPLFDNLPYMLKEGFP